MVIAEDLQRHPAMILAIGTANPFTFVDQSTYPDYYFRITNSEHKTELKEKFKRMCDRTMIKKRHICMTEEFLKENPNICTYMTPSLNTRQDISVVEVPKLGKDTAEKAIEEWGQPMSKITHLIFCSTAGIDMPGADYQLTMLLGLNPSVSRYMMYYLGCYGSGAVLRLAKDLAENNIGSRILVVCSELVTSMTFHGPSEANLSSLLGQSLFGDGAAALVVGSDPMAGVEQPLFQIASAAQTIIPHTHETVDGHLCDRGIKFNLSRDVPSLISDSIEKCLKKALDSFGVSDWNSLFWVVHPGGRAILDKLEANLGLKPEKLRSTRHVLSEYRNMLSASIFFMLDEMRKSSVKQGLSSTGEGHKWGVLFGFGLGLTVETLVLQSVPITTRA